MGGGQTRSADSGRARERQGSVTLRDVARACGLSVYPVSRVLSGKPGVNDETAAKVRQAAAALGYDVAQNDLARRLSLRKSGAAPVNHLIGVLMPGHVEKVRFFFELFRGISEAATTAGFGMLMLPTYDLVAHHGVPLRLPPSVRRGEVDGLLKHQGFDAELVRHLREDTAFGDRPLVTMDAPMAGCPAALRNHRLGAELALSHLLALGHRRVLYLRREPLGYPLDERVVGYHAACRHAGVSPAACLIPVTIAHDQAMDAPLGAAIATHPEATALRAQNDPTAVAACYLIQRLGRRVPEELSVVGFDDTEPFPDAAGANQLTSVRFDLAELGRRAARLLLDQVEGNPAQTEQVIIQPTLIVRGTTTAPQSR